MGVGIDFFVFRRAGRPLISSLMGVGMDFFVFRRVGLLLISSRTGVGMDSLVFRRAGLLRISSLKGVGILFLVLRSLRSARIAFFKGAGRLFLVFLRVIISWICLRRGVGKVGFVFLSPGWFLMPARSGVASARRALRRLGLPSISFRSGVASFFIFLAALSFGQASISLRIGVGRVLGVTFSRSSPSSFEAISLSPSGSSSPDAEHERKVSSNPVIEYSYSSSVSLSDRLASSISSSITSSSVSLVETERLSPPGVTPVLIGVLGGSFLSNTSGESMGPNVTLFLERFDCGPPLATSGTRSYTIAGSSLGLLRGDWETVVSSSSLMDTREEFRDCTEERLVKELLRDGMGVGTFSADLRCAVGVALELFSLPSFERGVLGVTFA